MMGPKFISAEVQEAYLRYAPAILGGDRKIRSEQAIISLVAYLRILINPHDDISLLRIINTPSRRLGPNTVDALVQFAGLEGASVYAAMQTVAEYKRDADEIVSGLGRRDRQRHAERLRLVTRAETIPFTLPQGSKQASSIQAFVRMVEDLIRLSTTTPVAQMIDHVGEITGYKAYLDGAEASRRGQSWASIEALRVRTMGFSNIEPEKNLGSFVETVSLLISMIDHDGILAVWGPTQRQYDIIRHSIRRPNTDHRKDCPCRCVGTGCNHKNKIYQSYPIQSVCQICNGHCCSNPDCGSSIGYADEEHFGLRCGTCPSSREASPPFFFVRFQGCQSFWVDRLKRYGPDYYARSTKIYRFCLSTPEARQLRGERKWGRDNRRRGWEPPEVEWEYGHDYRTWKVCEDCQVPVYKSIRRYEDRLEKERCRVQKEYYYQLDGLREGRKILTDVKRLLREKKKGGAV